MRANCRQSPLAAGASTSNRCSALGNLRSDDVKHLSPTSGARILNDSHRRLVGVIVAGGHHAQRRPGPSRARWLPGLALFELEQS